jgi:hypothetical protein
LSVIRIVDPYAQTSGGAVSHPLDLLPGQGNAEALLGVDQVVVVVGAEVDLHPVDLALEAARSCCVVRGDGGAGFVADIGVPKWADEAAERGDPPSIWCPIINPALLDAGPLSPNESQTTSVGSRCESDSPDA